MGKNRGFDSSAFESARERIYRETAKLSALECLIQNNHQGDLEMDEVGRFGLGQILSEITSRIEEAVSDVNNLYSREA